MTPEQAEKQSATIGGRKGTALSPFITLPSWGRGPARTENIWYARPTKTSNATLIGGRVRELSSS